jgi:hypothetical protein
MHVLISVEINGTFRAEVGASEIRVSWPDGRQEVTKSLGFSSTADTVEEAINCLISNYVHFMCRPHTERLNDFTRLDKRITS